MSKKRTVTDDAFDEEAPREYDFYAEHKRTAAMSERKVASFRKKNKILVSSTEQQWRPVTKFRRAGMDSALVKAVCKGFDRPSAIQSQCWPILLSGRDGKCVVVQYLVVDWLI